MDRGRGRGVPGVQPWPKKEEKILDFYAMNGHTLRVRQVGVRGMRKRARRGVALMVVVIFLSESCMRTYDVALRRPITATD